MKVLLRGSGVAVAAAAHLLHQRRLPVAIEPAGRRPVPVIMLGDAALALLRDVFARPALFAEKPRITRRIVRWGQGEAVAMPHGGIVVSEHDLAAALGPFGPGTAATPDFTLHALSPFPAGHMRRFGNRRAQAARVRLAPHAAPATCWVEAVAAGWLFLIPDAGGQAWVLAVGDEPGALMAQGRMIADLIDAIEPATDSFDTSPRMLDALAGEGWLACGMAALGFDPICGDGTAQATREAILGCAVIGGIGRGADPAPLLAHYQAMLLASMRRHLQLALPFYARGGTGEWWREQCELARHGYDWCTARLGALPEPQFLLRDFDLIPRAEIAA